MFFGHWDSDLLFVMGSAVATTAISFRFVLRRTAPIFTDVFSLSTNTVIDLKFLLGAILFGIVRGLYVYCPGPAVAAIVYLQPVIGIFLLTMLVGMFVGDKIL